MELADQVLDKADRVKNFNRIFVLPGNNVQHLQKPREQKGEVEFGDCFSVLLIFGFGT